MIRRMGSVFMLALVLAVAFETGRVYADSARLESKTSASSNSKDGQASASSQLTITDGEGVAIAIADSDVYQVAKNEIIEIYRTVEAELPKPAKLPVNKGEYCPSVESFIVEQAKAVALAAAKVTVDVSTEIIIDGEGSGCADAAASGQAFATATADLLVDAFVSAGIEGVDEAAADAILRAKSSGFAAAFADASAFACVEGPGEALANQIVTAEAIVKPIASILVFLEAFVDCSGFADSFADAEVGANLEDVVDITSEGGSTVSGVADAGTDASAGAFAGNICGSQPFKRCCTGSRAKALGNGETCFCNGLNRDGASARCKATKTILPGGEVVYEDQNSDFKCTCAGV